MIQLFIKYGINNTPQTYTASIDIVPKENAHKTTEEILSELTFLHNGIHDMYLLKEDFVIHVLTRLN